MLTVTKAPYVTRGIPGNISLWVGLFNPVVFRVQRADFIIQNVYDHGSQHIIWVNGAPSDLYTAGGAGKKFYIKTGAYDGVYAMSGIVQASGSAFVIYVNTMPHFGNATGGLINFNERKNYYAEFTVRVATEDYSYPTFRTFLMRKKPDAKGEIILDVSSVLKGILPFKNDFLYDVTNRGDNHLSGSFQIDYQDFWYNAEGVLGTFDHQYQFINGAKQIGQAWGSNFAEYVPFVNMTDTTPAYFLTDFRENSKYWEGYPWDVSWIYRGELIGYYGLYRIIEEELDVNGNVIQTTARDILSGAYSSKQPNIGKINRTMLRGGYQQGEQSYTILKIDDIGIRHLVHITTSTAAIYVQGQKMRIQSALYNGEFTVGTAQNVSPTEWFLRFSDMPHIGDDLGGGLLTYTADVDSVNVSIRIHDYYYDTVYGLDGYVDDYWVQATPVGATELDVVNFLNVKIAKCERNPVYLCWLNSLGGWDYFMFEKTQDYTLNVFEADSYSPDVIDIQTDSREDWIGKKARYEVKLGANNLNPNEVIGISRMLTSPKVYLVGTAGALTMDTVLVKKGSFNLWRTDSNKADIEFTIEMPEQYLQSNI